MSKAKVMTLADELGATIDDCGTTIVLDAPHRHVNACDWHSYTYDVLDGRSHVWRAILDDLKQGFTPCTAIDCEVCE